MSKGLNHILYVDDEDDILQIAGMCLETVGGYKVTLCSNGEDGYDTIIKEKPDLVLLDVMMPKIDGPNTLRKIRSNSEIDGIPIIFMTARVQQEDIEKYLSLGAAGIIEKPFNPMTLSSQVAEIWQKSFK